METEEDPREKADDEKGAEGGESESKERPPGAPAEDDAPLGDTDQHSGADA
jgi:hypothetical protein